MADLTAAGRTWSKPTAVDVRDRTESTTLRFRRGSPRLCCPTPSAVDAVDAASATGPGELAVDARPAPESPFVAIATAPRPSNASTATAPIASGARLFFEATAAWSLAPIVSADGREAALPPGSSDVRSGAAAGSSGNETGVAIVAALLGRFVTTGSSLLPCGVIALPTNGASAWARSITDAKRSFASAAIARSTTSTRPSGSPARRLASGAGFNLRMWNMMAL